MAERLGFEPRDGFNPVNCLAGSCLQPLGHLSATCPNIYEIADFSTVFCADLFQREIFVRQPEIMSAAERS